MRVILESDLMDAYGQENLPYSLVSGNTSIGDLLIGMSLSGLGPSPFGAGQHQKADLNLSAARGTTPTALPPHWNSELRKMPIT